MTPDEEHARDGLERYLKSAKLVYTVHPDSIELAFEGDPPLYLTLAVEGGAPLAFGAYVPIRVEVEVTPSLWEWALEVNRGLVFGRVDIVPDEEPVEGRAHGPGSVVYYFAIFADEVPPSALGAFLTVALNTAKELIERAGDRFGGVVFDGPPVG